MNAPVPGHERRLMEERRGDEEAVEGIAGPGERHGQRNENVERLLRRDHSGIRSQGPQDLIGIHFELADFPEELQLEADHGRDEEGGPLEQLLRSGPENLGAALPKENGGVGVQEGSHGSGLHSQEVSTSSSGVQFRASRRGRSASFSRRPPAGTIISVRSPRITSWGTPVSRTSSSTR